MKARRRLARGALSLCALLLTARLAAADTSIDALVALAASAPGEMVFFDQPRPPQQTRIVLAAAVRVPLDFLRARLGHVAFYRAAVPWFVRSDVVAQTGAMRTLAWELEVPLWNLEGTLRFTPHANGVDLELIDGDMAPGRFKLSAVSTNGTTILVVEARANVPAMNFVTRRLAAQHPLSEPAMTATASYVLLRALALEAEKQAGRPAPRWPRSTMRAPAPSAMSRGLGSARAPLDVLFGRRQIVARVRSRADGRLDHVSVAFAASASPPTIKAQLTNPSAWRALPGWKRIDVAPASAASTTAADPGSAAWTWTVASSMPFVDFDAVWEIAPGPPFLARAIADDWKGAALRWDVLPWQATGSVATLALHGRVDATGYIPRRLIEAEPLLEHGLSLGLAYVDGMALLGTASSK